MDMVTIWFDFRDERDKVEIRRAINELARLCHIEAVITNDWELYKEPFEEKRIPHQVCLAHNEEELQKEAFPDQRRVFRYQREAY